jgi:hypothetical protein
MLFNAHLYMHIILLQTGGGTEDTFLHTVRGVDGLGIRMLTLYTKSSLSVRDRRLQVPMVLDRNSELEMLPQTIEVENLERKVYTHNSVVPVMKGWE